MFGRKKKYIKLSEADYNALVYYGEIAMRVHSEIAGEISWNLENSDYIDENSYTLVMASYHAKNCKEDLDDFHSFLNELEDRFYK